MNDFYKLIEQRDLTEISSKGYWYEHVKTGAQIVYVSNADINKIFSAAFKTIPLNSSGTPHIMEHCILSGGSKKYPVKNPFSELQKSSLAVYLNGMTFNDKTVYPLASFNQKDFMNLVSVYLDCLFAPLIFENKESFLQEGWHYELDSPDGNLKINGVVYNEMKGVFSDPMGVLFRKSMGLIFPGSCYAHDSGGNPDEIPNLSYEEFLQFHRDYYHPSNSIFYFYGDVDIDSCLTLLDSYLSQHEKQLIDSSVKPPVPFASPAEHETLYAGAEGDDKNLLMACYALEDITSCEEYFALPLLSDILVSTRVSPLNLALSAAAIGESIGSQVDLQMNTSTLLINVRNSTYDGPGLKKVIMQALEKIVKDGLDPRLINAVIDKLEFSTREGNSGQTRGMNYNTLMLSNLRYGKNPFEKFEQLHFISQIREKAKSRYFEQLIEKYLLNNNHAVYLTSRPKAGLAEEREAALAKKLSDYKASLSESEKQAIINENIKLRELQTKPNKKEDLDKIPRVGLCDLSRKAIVPPLDVINKPGFDILHSDIETSGIIYATFMFNGDKIPVDKIKNIALLNSLMGNLTTTQKRSWNSTGNLLFGHALPKTRDGSCKSIFSARTKTISSNMKNMLNSAAAVINTTVFEEKEQIYKTLGGLKINLQNDINRNGNSVAASRALSYLFDTNRYVGSYSGINLYFYLCRLLSNFDETYEQLKSDLYELKKLIFNKQNFSFSVCCSKTLLDEITPELEEFFSTLSDDRFEPQGFDIKADVANEAFIIPSRLQFNAAAYDYSGVTDYNGAMPVLFSIISKDYLMTELRAKGGAYGYSASADRSGAVIMSSFRDPQLANTYKVFDNVYNYVKGCKLDKAEMENYIMSVAGGNDTPMTPQKIHSIAIDRYFTKYPPELIQSQREQMLDCTPKDILAAAEALSSCAGTKKICTIGGETGITENSGLFDKIIKLPF